MKRLVAICFSFLLILTLTTLGTAEEGHVCFTALDSNSDSKVTFQEFELVYDENSKEKFSAIDSNGDGSLSHDEYHVELGHGES